MLFSEYKHSVILAYRKQKNDGALSLNLSEPTCATIRDECIKVLSNRYLKKDEKTLRLFFNFHKDSDDFTSEIFYKPDRFKSLVNYLKENTTDTSKKNIELLAWLIDFEGRPFVSLYSNDNNIVKPDQGPTISNNPDTTEEPPNSPIIDPPDTGDGPDKPHIDSHNKWKGWKGKPIPKKAVALITIPLLLIGGFYSYTGRWTKAYICDRGTAKKYHLTDKCPSLKNCKNGVVSTTIVEAKKNGKTQCEWEKHKSFLIP